MAKRLPSKHAMMREDMLLTGEERTFQHEEDLPNLPIPTLQHTTERYLDSVKPFLTKKEFLQTRTIVQDFASGVGKELHAKLHLKAQHVKNWLETWWEEQGYLRWRKPVTLLNMAGPGPYSQDVWPAQAGTQIHRSALMLYYIIKFWQILREETLCPHKDRKGRPLSMVQFHRLFSTCKVPGYVQDQMLYHFQTEREGDSPSHVVVACKGYWFALDCLKPNGELVSPPEYEALLQQIVDLCESRPPGDGIAAMTADERLAWAKARNHLVAVHPQNFESLDVIQKAIIVLGLDDGSPSTESELVWEGLFGNIDNKWLDKSLNFVAFKNGLFVSSCDHAPFDAMVLVFCTYYVHARLMETRGKWQGSRLIEKRNPIKELKFVIDDEIKAAIQSARATHRKMGASVQTQIYHYKGFGKDVAKAVNLHPDAFVQLALQLTFYKLHAKPAPTYETATTRQFYHARTETMRSCTPEAYEWCQMMCNRSITDSWKYRQLVRAVERHVKLMDEACNMQGCDRHLFGLAMIAVEEGMEIPDIFCDPAFTKSGGGGNYQLSTSSVGYTTVFGGVAPMCKDGYGVFYKTDSNQIDFFLTCWTEDEKTDTQLFSRMLGHVFDSMKTLASKHKPLSHM